MSRDRMKEFEKQRQNAPVQKLAQPATTVTPAITIPPATLTSTRSMNFNQKQPGSLDSKPRKSFFGKRKKLTRSASHQDLNVKSEPAMGSMPNLHPNAFKLYDESEAQNAQGQAFVAYISSMMHLADEKEEKADSLLEEAHLLYGRFNNAAFNAQAASIKQSVSRIVEQLNSISMELKKLARDFSNVNTHDNAFSERMVKTHATYFQDKYYDHITKLLNLRGQFDSAASEKQNQRNQAFTGVFGSTTAAEGAGEGEGELAWASVDLEEWYTHVLDETKARHAQMQKLEKSIVTLHSLFKDMAVLVNEQGSKLNTIEAAINATDSNLLLIRAELKSSLDYQKKVRIKKMVAGGTAALGVTAGVLGIVKPPFLPF